MPRVTSLLKNGPGTGTQRCAAPESKRLTQARTWIEKSRVSNCMYCSISTELGTPSNSYGEALTLNAIVFGDRALREVIKVQ